MENNAPHAMPYRYYHSGALSRPSRLRCGRPAGSGSCESAHVWWIKKSFPKVSHGFPTSDGALGLPRFSNQNFKHFQNLVFLWISLYFFCCHHLDSRMVRFWRCFTWVTPVLQCFSGKSVRRCRTRFRQDRQK